MVEIIVRGSNEAEVEEIASDLLYAVIETGTCCLYVKSKMLQKLETRMAEEQLRNGLCANIVQRVFLTVEIAKGE